MLCSIPRLALLAMERAFAAYSTGQAELPSVIQLDVPEHKGEIHIKAGYIRGGGLLCGQNRLWLSEQSQAWARGERRHGCCVRRANRCAVRVSSRQRIHHRHAYGRGGGVRGEASGAKTDSYSGGYRNWRAGAVSGGDAGRGKKFQRGPYSSDTIRIRLRPVQKTWVSGAKFRHAILR